MSTQRNPSKATPPDDAVGGSLNGLGHDLGDGRLSVTPRQKTARISPDRPSVGVAAILLVVVIMSASYVFSFASISEAAAWSGTAPELRPIAPIFIDGPILAYTITYTVFRYRREPSRRSIVVLYVFTIISTIVNVAHALIFNGINLERWETWVGSLIAAAAPLGALLASEEVIRLALVPPQLPPALGAAPGAAPAAPGKQVLVEEAPEGDSGLNDAPSSPPEPKVEATDVAASEADVPPFDPDYDGVPDERDTVDADLWAVASTGEVSELDLVLLEDGKVSA